MMDGGPQRVFRVEDSSLFLDDLKDVCEFFSAYLMKYGWVVAKGKKLLSRFG